MNPTDAEVESMAGEILERFGDVDELRGKLEGLAARACILAVLRQRVAVLQLAEDVASFVPADPEGDMRAFRAAVAEDVRRRGPLPALEGFDYDPRPGVAVGFLEGCRVGDHLHIDGHPHVYEVTDTGTDGEGIGIRRLEKG